MTSIGYAENTPALLNTDTDTKQLLKDILQTLKSSTIAQETGIDNRSRLWATYRREAKEFDDEFLEKYRDDMDIVLIFAGLFSAVSTTFITSMQSSLSPDPTATTNTLLMRLVQATNTSAFAGQDLELPLWNGPGSTVIWSQSLIYASLATSLLAALGAVLGKQWLAHYRQTKFGTREQRALYRQAKRDALERWRFQTMLGVLPVLLQISLLLFGIALSAYVWTQQATIAAVVIGATALGLSFYAFIALASAFSQNCPFQTPLTNVIKLLWQPMALLAQIMKALCRDPVQSCWSRIARGKGRVPDPEKAEISSPSPESKLELKIHEYEAPAVRWLLEISTDQEVLLTGAKMVPDIEWPVEVDVSEIYVQLGNAFKGCFVSAPGGTGLRLAPLAQNRALVFGKALLHLFCNRLYLSDSASDVSMAHRDYNRTLLEGFECLARFSEGTSAALFKSMANTLLGGCLFREAGLLPISQSDRSWTLHLLPHLLAHPRCSLEIKRLAVTEIIRWLGSPSPPHHILVDCCLSVAIMLGMRVNRKDLVGVVNNSLADLFMRKFLQQSASVVDATAVQQETLLCSLAPFLEKCQIYPNFDTCDSKACLCDKVDSVMTIYTSCMDRVQQATDAESRAETLNRARAVLRLGVVLSVFPLDRYHKQNRWNPTYHGHPVRFVMVGPESTVDFLQHHYNLRDDEAVADAFFMLSQSRNVEQWATSSLFIDEIIRGMEHKAEHVRHSSLQLVRRMRHALTTSEPTVVAAISSHLCDLIPSVRFDDDTGQLLCCLQIIFSFTLYYRFTWVTDFLQKVSDSLLKLLHAKSIASNLPVYLLALLEIVEGYDIKCSFRSSFDDELRSQLLPQAWLALSPLINNELNSDTVDEVLPNLIAFTNRYHNDNGSTTSETLDHAIHLFHHLRAKRPESPSIPLLRELLSKLHTYGS